MKIWLHIGHQKCGSKSIQSFLLHSREALLSKGFISPIATKVGNYDMGLQAFAGDHSCLRIMADQFNCDPQHDIKSMIARHLEDELSRSEAHTAIFSFEGLLSMAQDEVYEVLRLLRGLAEEVCVYATVRRQDRWAVSNYTTRLKNNLSYEMDILKDLTGEPYNVCYSSALRVWESCVSLSSIVVDAFEDHPDIVKRFDGVLGLDIAGSSGIRENIGLSAYGQEVLRRFNLLCRNRADWRVKAFEIKDKLYRILPKGEPALPSKSDVIEFLKKFENDHNVLLREYLKPDSQFFYETEYPPVDERPNVSADEVEQWVVRAEGR